MEQIDYKFIDQVLADHACDASQIIAIMQDVQGKYRYLPKDALRYIADKVGISESKIYGVATFYENFSLDVKGKYVLKVCRGTACHVRKSGNVLQALYDATSGKVQDDKTRASRPRTTACSPSRSCRASARAV